MVVLAWAMGAVEVEVTRPTVVVFDEIHHAGDALCLWILAMTRSGRVQETTEAHQRLAATHPRASMLPYVTKVRAAALSEAESERRPQ